MNVQLVFNFIKKWWNVIIWQIWWIKEQFIYICAPDYLPNNFLKFGRRTSSHPLYTYPFPLAHCFISMYFQFGSNIIIADSLNPTTALKNLISFVCKLLLWSYHSTKMLYPHRCIERVFLTNLSLYKVRFLWSFVLVVLKQVCWMFQVCREWYNSSHCVCWVSCFVAEFGIMVIDLNKEVTLLDSFRALLVSILW